VAPAFGEYPNAGAAFLGRSRAHDEAWCAMTYSLMYGAVTDRPRKVIHVVRVVDDVLDVLQAEDIAERMRQRMLARHGEQTADVVVIQGASRETLRLHGEPHAVTRVRAALFNAAISWSAIQLD
jgi:hypothetical protein